MEIFISDIPAEGLQRQGVIPKSIFDLLPEDSIRPVSDISYVANMHRFEEAVSFYGQLKGKFQLRCSTCLEYFEYEADFSNWKSELDLEDRQVAFDLAELIREDFLLDLPSHPHCDELIEGRTCPKAHLLVEDQLPIEEEAKPKAGDDAWGALDELS